MADKKSSQPAPKPAAKPAQPPKPAAPAQPPAAADPAQSKAGGPTPQDEYMQQILARIAMDQPDLLAKIINQWLSEDKKANG